MTSVNNPSILLVITSLKDVSIKPTFFTDVCFTQKGVCTLFFMELTEFINMHVVLSYFPDTFNVSCAQHELSTNINICFFIWSLINSAAFRVEKQVGKKYDFKKE